MSERLAAVLCAWLAGASPESEVGAIAVSTAVVDSVTFERGLVARVGESLESWRVEVAGGADPDVVLVTVVRPDGHHERREIRLKAEDPEAGARELAAMVALIIDEYQAPDPAVARSDSRRGFLGVLGRVGVGSPPHVDGGVGLVGGAWLVRDHLQPRLGVSWSVSTSGPLILQGLRFGPELAAGAPVGGRLWVGGLVAARAQWVRAQATSVDSTWVFSPSVGPLLQVRWSRWFIELAAAGELGLPPVSAFGEGRQLRWGLLRAVGGGGVGARF